MGGLSLQYDPQLCNGCKMCTIVCPHQVLQSSKRKIEIVARSKCIECGACMMNCEKKAITVDIGVGCATAVLNGMIKNTKPTCGCSASCS